MIIGFWSGRQNGGAPRQKSLVMGSQLCVIMFAYESDVDFVLYGQKW